MKKDILEMQKVHLDNIINERKDGIGKEIEDKFILNYTYDAISLEGNNRIPFEDVKRLINKKIFLDYTEREQKEVLNHVKAFLKLKSFIDQELDLSEEMIKDLHEIIVEGIFQGGFYRNVNIQLMGSMHQPTDHAKVYDRMHKLFTEIKSKNFNSKIEKAVYAHAGISKIHPFLDANGRVARMVLNFYLMKEGYLPISIPFKDKIKYIELLEIFKIEKNLVPLTQYFKDLLINRYEETINSLEV